MSTISLGAFLKPGPRDTTVLQGGFRKASLTHVDLDHTVADGVEVFLLAASRAAVEDQKDRLAILAASLLLHKLLMLGQQFRV